MDPYVGGRTADGARRSAQIVREEMDTLSRGNRRREELEARAGAWDQLADAWAIVEAL